MEDSLNFQETSKKDENDFFSLSLSSPKDQLWTYWNNDIESQLETGSTLCEQPIVYFIIQYASDIVMRFCSSSLL